jgi:CRISPR system Cascade subunit CasE
MDAIHDIPPADRSDTRKDLLVQVATEWMNARSAKCGFVFRPHKDQSNNPMELDPVQVLGYRVMRMDRGKNQQKLSVGVLDLQGQLEVSNPESFVDSINQGFGRAKAFGCGLMLIKRA